MKVAIVLALLCITQAYNIEQPTEDDQPDLVYEQIVPLTEEGGSDFVDIPDINKGIEETIGLGGYTLVEGDIAVDPRQPESAIHWLSRRWTQPVKYRFGNVTTTNQSDPSGHTKAKTIIREAISAYHDWTCITFEEIEEDIGEPHLLFVDQGVCRSYVGMVPWFNATYVSLGPNCFSTDDLSTPIHELGHAMGLYHEQSRSDRNESVTIMWDNIQPTKRAHDQFEQQLQSLNYTVKYDYLSVMHYGKTFFGKYDAFGRKMETMRTKNAVYADLIGRVKGFGFGDTKILNIMYNCSKHCDPLPVCKNRGYVDKNCVCVCPVEYTGTLCETPTNKSPIECGGIITEESDIETTNFPNEHEGAIVCSWLIKVGTGRKAHINVTDTVWSRQAGRWIYSNSPCVGYINVYKKDLWDNSELGPKAYWCNKTSGTPDVGTIITAEDTDLRIVFSTNYNTPNTYGLKMHVSFLSDGAASTVNPQTTTPEPTEITNTADTTTTTAPTTPPTPTAKMCAWKRSGSSYMLTSPGFGGMGFAAGSRCRKTLRNVKPVKYIATVVANSIPRTQCRKTRIYIKVEKKVINLCGARKSSKFTLATGNMDVFFTSSVHGVKAGFKLMIKPVRSGCYKTVVIGGRRKQSYFRSPRKGPRYHPNVQCEVLVKNVDRRNKCIRFIGSGSIMGSKTSCLRGGGDYLVASPRADPFYRDARPICGPARRFSTLSRGRTMRVLWYSDKARNNRKGFNAKFMLSRRCSK